MNIVRYLGMRGRTLRGKTVVHVGAHLGQEATRYQNWGAARVVWVEAEPNIFKRLQQNIEAVTKQPMGLLPRMLKFPATEHILINALVGEADQGSRTFHLYDNDGASNSVFQLVRDDKNRFEQVHEVGQVLELPIRSLDRLLEDKGVTPGSVDVLVVDIQGAELMCLKGASQVLAAAKYLEVEVSVEPVYQGGVLLSELEPWLKERGFQRRTLVRKVHQNAIFIRP